MNETLTELDLEDNQLGDEGAIAIAEHLKTDKHLKELYLNKNKLERASPLPRARAPCSHASAARTHALV